MPIKMDGPFRNTWYRGKDFYHGDKWYHGDLIDHSVFGPVNYIALPYANTVDSIIFAKVHPETVGPCSGRKDKRGILIYHGDILMSRYDDQYPEDYCLEVIVYDGHKWLSYQNGVGEPDELDEKPVLGVSEIVGNIWDNPELLTNGGKIHAD